jgi:hypothetical protein
MAHYIQPNDVSRAFACLNSVDPIPANEYNVNVDSDVIEITLLTNDHLRMQKAERIILEVETRFADYPTGVFVEPLTVVIKICKKS